MIALSPVKTATRFLPPPKGAACFAGCALSYPPYKTLGVLYCPQRGRPSLNIVLSLKPIFNIVLTLRGAYRNLSLFTIHYSLFTIHCREAANYPLLTNHYPLTTETCNLRCETPPAIHKKYNLHGNLYFYGILSIKCSLYANIFS